MSTAPDPPAGPATPDHPPPPRRSRWRWVRRGYVGAVLLLLLLASPLACTTRVEPPARVRDPVTVFLLDHGRTPSLVLPDDAGGLVRYAYGDWTWYARADTGVWNGVRALCWPTPGTLGRRRMTGPATREGLTDRLTVPVEHVYPIVVERDAARRLREGLDRIHRDHADTMVVNAAYGLDFVHHPRDYTYFHNSNHEAAYWLRQLGCRVTGPAFASRWEVAPPLPD